MTYIPETTLNLQYLQPVLWRGNFRQIGAPEWEDTSKSRSYRTLHWLRDNPGSSARSVAANFDWSLKDSAATCSALLKLGKVTSVRGADFITRYTLSEDGLCTSPLASAIISTLRQLPLQTAGEIAKGVGKTAHEINSTLRWMEERKLIARQLDNERSYRNFRRYLWTLVEWKMH